MMTESPNIEFKESWHDEYRNGFVALPILFPVPVELRHGDAELSVSFQLVKMTAFQLWNSVVMLLVYGQYFKFEYPQRATIQEQSETIQKTIQKQMSKQQEAILAYLSKYPYATRKELVENIPDATIGGIIHNLSRLQGLGLLKRLGGRKQGYWQIVEPQNDI